MIRRLASVVLIVLGGIALFAGVLARYADQNVLDPERFAERAVEALDDDGARSEVADVIVVELEKLGADRREVSPVVDRAVGTVAEDPRFRTALAAALVRANRAVLEDEREGVGVVVEDVGDPLRRILGERSPELARLIPLGIDLRVAHTASTGTLVDAARAADDVSGAAALLPFLAAGLLLAGIAVARDRRTAAFGAGLTVALVGALIFGGYLLGREIAAAQPEDEPAQEAARAIWSAVFGGLSELGLILAGAGIVVAFIAAVATRVRGPARA